jgi:hypothetical protein
MDFAGSGVVAFKALGIGISSKKIAAAVYQRIIRAALSLKKFEERQINEKNSPNKHGFGII